MSEASKENSVRTESAGNGEEQDRVQEEDGISNQQAPEDHQSRSQDGSQGRKDRAQEEDGRSSQQSQDRRNQVQDEDGRSSRHSYSGSQSHNQLRNPSGEDNDHDETRSQVRNWNGWHTCCIA